MKNYNFIIFSKILLNFISEKLFIKFKNIKFFLFEYFIQKDEFIKTFPMFLILILITSGIHVFFPIFFIPLVAFYYNNKIHSYKGFTDHVFDTLLLSLVLYAGLISFLILGIERKQTKLFDINISEKNITRTKSGAFLYYKQKDDFMTSEIRIKNNCKNKNTFIYNSVPNISWINFPDNYKLNCKDQMKIYNILR